MKATVNRGARNAPVLISALLLLLVGTVGAGGASAEARYVGYAYDLEDGELIYTEYHQEVATGEDELRLQTTYADPAGETFARREVRFRGERPGPRPDFEMEDLRLAYREGVAAVADGFRVFKEEDGEGREKVLEPRKRPLVIDAGFDRFVQQEWERLQAGEFVRFDFVNCDRLSLIALRLSRQANRETEYGTVTDFEMEPNNWLIRMLVSSIVITYRDEDRSLLEYRGISNVKRMNGSNHVVRIFFPPDERSTGDSAIARREAGSGHGSGRGR